MPPLLAPLQLLPFEFAGLVNAALNIKGPLRLRSLCGPDAFHDLANVRANPNRQTSVERIDDSFSPATQGTGRRQASEQHLGRQLQNTMESTPSSSGIPGPADDRPERNSRLDDFELYERFGEWLDGELEKLVARWIHLAAPNADRRERSLRQRC